AYFLPVNSADRIERFIPQDKKLLHRHLRDVVQLLSDHRNFVFPGFYGVRDYHLLPIKQNLSLIGLMNPVDDFAECRFPRPVLSAKNMYGPWADRERHML